MTPPNQDNYSSNGHLESLGNDGIRNSFFFEDKQSSLKSTQMSYQKERGKQYHRKSVLNYNKSSSQQESTPPRHHRRRRSFYPSMLALFFGHTSSLLIFSFRLLFQSNNLPLLINFIYHFVTTRLYLGKSRTRYITINNNPEQSATASGPVTLELFRYLSGLHSSLAALSILTLVISRKDSNVSLSNEKLALLVLGIASGSTTLFDLRHNRTFFKERRGGFTLFVALMNAVAYFRS
ncbi:12345_t:CDS:1, partial [Ambispora gerdemannii]